MRGGRGGSGLKQIVRPTIQVVLLYLLKILFGSESMHELPRVLFSNVGLMELVGFNAQQCEEGLTKRGDAQRKTKKKQGPITPQCLADNISKIKQEEMERLLNRMVHVLARFGLLCGPILAALDGPSGYLNVDSAAAFLDTSPAAIRAMVKRGELPVTRTPTGRILFSRSALDAGVRGEAP